jgi:hypothetical protein
MAEQGRVSDTQAIQREMTVRFWEQLGVFAAISGAFAARNLNIEDVRTVIGSAWFLFKATQLQVKWLLDLLWPIDVIESIKLDDAVLSRPPGTKTYSVPAPPLHPGDKKPERMKVRIDCAHGTGRVNAITQRITACGGNIESLTTRPPQAGMSKAWAVLDLTMTLSPDQCFPLGKALGDVPASISYGFVKDESKAPDDVLDNNSYNPAADVVVAGEGTISTKRTKKRRPGRPGLDAKTKREILRSAKRNHNFSQVARKHRVSTATVARIAEKEGIHAGGPSGVPISDDKRNKVLLLWSPERSYNAVGAEVGIDHKSVAKIVREEQEKAERRPRQSPPSAQPS